MPAYAIGKVQMRDPSWVEEYGAKIQPLLIAVFTCVRLFLCRGEACLRAGWLDDHEDRPYMGRIHLQTAIRNTVGGI